MRLLRTGPYVPGEEKLEVIQVWGKDIPPYAILSHTWSTDPEHEVLYSDVQNSTCSRKPAYTKLEKAMERAKLDGYGWLWIDTCCIDKASSVELSEAINSMYEYYKDAQKCYCYLSDVADEDTGEMFRNSRWWRRGWTLQEFLAPRKVEFFNSAWTLLGRKDTLHKIISTITGIERHYLIGELPVEHASIAKRMSWAANRETRRAEDIAYSLIGIFGVNMPMLYGEGGTRAFVRLQEEIMKDNEDQSLFAWVKDASHALKDESDSYHGLLADSPKDFERTGQMISYSDVGTYNPPNMTARGLHLTLPLTPKEDGTVIAALQCPAPRRGYNDWIAVYLRQLPIGSDQYARVNSGKLAEVTELGRQQEVYVRQKFPGFETQIIYPYHYFQLRSLTATSDYSAPASYNIVDCRCDNLLSRSSVRPMVPPQPWSEVSLVYRVNKAADALTVALLIERKADKESFVVMLGEDSSFGVGIAVREGKALDKFDEMQRTFLAQRPGEHVQLEFHSVRVSVETQVRDKMKIHFVDLAINGIPKPPTVSEVLFVRPNDAAAGPDRRGRPKQIVSALYDRLARRASQ